MTTFHSKRIIAGSDVSVVMASASEPDAIGAEVHAGEDELFSIYFEDDGRRSIRLWLNDVEFDATEFRDLINKLHADLEAWETNLRKPAGAWDRESPYYKSGSWDEYLAKVEREKPEE